MTVSPQVSTPQSRRRRSAAWLLLLALLPLALAVWQYRRGEQRSAQLAAFERAANLPARHLAEIARDAAPNGQRVWLTARSSAPSLRVAGAVLNGRDGVRELQAVRLIDGSWVVIDRGWLPRPVGIMSLPLPTGRLSGRWVVRPSPYLLSKARIGIDGEVDALDWKALAASLPGPLRDGLVVLEPTLRPYTTWPVQPGFDPQRHYAYALQWLLLAGCVVIGALVMMRRQHAQHSGN
ncbi:SURF1 family protein [Vogesella oryzae]|uniref:SURF1 family protein n=1 Tax=Vogesella oryzae TaxID=1735285 RepID=UPI0015822623|nr:SURF1 family protein [Vogesella oryzae]